MQKKDLLRRQISEILREFSDSDEEDGTTASEDPGAKKYAFKNKCMQRLYNTIPIPKKYLHHKNVTSATADLLK
jgi:hypothetical protein